MPRLSESLTANIHQQMLNETVFLAIITPRNCTDILDDRQLKLTTVYVTALTTWAVRLQHRMSFSVNIQATRPRVKYATS